MVNAARSGQPRYFHTERPAAGGWTGASPISDARYNSRVVLSGSEL